jgi:hypothetical protein
MIVCFYRPEGDFPIKLEQYETSRASYSVFRVTYGEEVEDHPTYDQAALALGSALMHCLACEGKLNPD